MRGAHYHHALARQSQIAASIFNCGNKLCLDTYHETAQGLESSPLMVSTPIAITTHNGIKDAITHMYQVNPRRASSGRLAEPKLLLS